MATITRPARRPKIKSPLDAVRPDQDLLDQIAPGTVCVSGGAFSCKNANVVSDRGAPPEQTADTVRITREVPLDRPRAAPKKRRASTRRKAR